MTISTSTVTKLSAAALISLAAIAAAPTAIAAASSLTLPAMIGIAAGALAFAACTAIGVAKSYNMITVAMDGHGFSGLMLPFFAVPAIVGALAGVALSAPIANGVATAAACFI